MPRQNEPTTKFKVDISELRKEFQEAQQHIRLVNSEFKASTAGLNNWASDADGLGAKLKQLNGTLDAETIKLKSLEQQYQLTAKEQGENSKGAQDLLIKLNNQRAAVEKVKSSIGYYSDQLNDVTNESKQTESATESLKNTISQQEATLASLRAKYASLVVEQKGSSDEAVELSNKIKSLSSDLNANKSSLNSAETAASNLDRTFDALEVSTESTSDGFTVMKGALASLLADGITAVAGGLRDFVAETDGAYSNFQAQTGASAQEMKEFKSEMNDLYKSNFGESLQDVGDKMAYVKQVTGEVDPSKIKELTENAITLQDTFGSDFNETVRGVNNLMKHFGIDSTEAFDLFAKGSQLGLDYTDELGDNISEYGGNFQQAGYSAEEYFQLLQNGSKGGAYNLDKVNDSINEVKNRLGDGTIKKNLSMFSDGTNDAFTAWENGEGTMKDVIDSIVKDINNCTSEQDALTLSATAFGTMGEDANLKVIKSLTSVGDNFKDVKGTMEDVKKVKYGDVKSEFIQLGRTIQTDVFMPLMQKALPAAKEFVKFCTTNLDTIIPIVMGIGAAFSAIFVANKLAMFVTSLKTLGTTFGIVKIATDAQTASTLALNTAWLASPITWLIAGAAALALGVAHLAKEQEKAIEKEYGLSKAQKETIKSSSELNDAYTQLNDARNKAMSSVTTEYGYLSGLKNEYNGLIDSNGKVKQGYEDRANFIINQLAQALGIEREKVLENVDANGKLTESIDQIIQKKQAELTLQANEQAYTEAIQKRNEALSTYQNSLTTLESAENKYKSTKEKANEVMKIYDELLKSNPEAAAGYLISNSKIVEANDKAKESYDKAKKGVKDSEEAYVGYNSTIKNYEGLSAAIISGDSVKIQNALLNMQNNFITAENGTKKSLENQVKNMEKNYKDLKTAIENNTPGVTQEMVDQAKQMVDKSSAELDKYSTKAGESGKKAGKSAADGIKSTAEDNKNAGKDVADKQNEGLNSSNTGETGTKKGEEFKKGIESTKDLNLLTAQIMSGDVNSSLGKISAFSTGSNKGSEFSSGVGSQSDNANKQGKNVADSSRTGMGSVTASGEGRGLTSGFNSGVGSVSTSATGEGRANDAKSGMGSVSAYNTGNNFTKGFSNGISLGSAASSIWDTAWNLGKKALGALAAAIKEGSPSKATYKSGGFFVDGFANAISDGVKQVEKQAKKLGFEALSSLNDELNSGVDMPAINNIKSGMKASNNITKNRRNVANKNDSGATYVTNNFSQTNNSPKPLSRLDIYRQTKNQLALVKG